MSNAVPPLVAAPANPVISGDKSLPGDGSLPATGEFAGLVADLLAAQTPAAAAEETLAAGGNVLPPETALAANPQTPDQALLLPGLPLPIEPLPPAASAPMPKLDEQALLATLVSESQGPAHRAANDPIGVRPQTEAKLVPATAPETVPDQLLAAVTDATVAKSVSSAIGSVVAETPVRPAQADVAPAGPSAPLAGLHAMPSEAPATSQTTNIPAPLNLHRSDFDEALANRVMWMTGRQMDTAQIQITPADLGPIEIRIQVSNDQASVTFGAAQAQTREALEAALPKLRELLGQQGLNLADVNIAQHGFTRGQQQGGAEAQTPAYTPAQAAAESSGPLPRIERRGLLDVYV
jgi:flagellar hook-length control protein FliK